MKKIFVLFLILMIMGTSGCIFVAGNGITYIDNDEDEGVKILESDDTSASYVDDEIKKSIIDDINLFDKKIVDAMVNNDADTVQETMRGN